MKNLIITQKIMTFRLSYQVKNDQSEDIINTIKGNLLAIKPKLVMKQGIDGNIVKILKGNFLRNRFLIESSDGKAEASVHFPIITMLKRFVLTLGEITYKAKGSISAWYFICENENGNTIFTISKEYSYRDTINVKIDDSIPQDILIMVAIAVDQKYFTQR